MLGHTDNTSVVSYVNHQGWLHSRPIFRQAQQILLRAENKFLDGSSVGVGAPQGEVSVPASYGLSAGH